MHVYHSSLELGVRGPVVTGVCTKQHLIALVVWHRMVHNAFLRNLMHYGLVLCCTKAATCDVALYELVQSCACAVLHRLARTRHSTALCSSCTAPFHNLAVLTVLRKCPFCTSL